MTLRKNAKEIAGKGRFGDDSLLHVSKEELKGLASIHPEGKLPKNPDTGLPEAFFFLPFLAGLGSMFGGAAATGATLGATTAATAAAIPAATTAATLGTAALPAAAETAALSAVPATTAALPALEGAMGTSSLLGSGGLDTLAATAPSSTAPLFNGAMNAATTGAITPSPLEAAVAPATTATTASPLSTTVAAPSTIPGLNATVPSATLLGPAPSTPLGGSGLSSLLQYGALGAMMMPQSAPEMDEDKEPKIGKDTYHRGKANFDDSGDGEHDYFPNSHYSNEENKKGKKIKFAGGGLVRGFAEGGLASMDEGGAPPDDNALIDATRDAIVQQSPEADALIQQFLAVFGKQALQDLIAGIQQQGAQGDGMSDSIPATINGKDGSQGLASLSDGEFVLPADVVSGLGNGSTDAGAKHLDGMVDRVRQSRQGGTQQPPALEPSQVMPA